MLMIGRASGRERHATKIYFYRPPSNKISLGVSARKIPILYNTMNLFHDIAQVRGKNIYSP